MLVLVAQSTVVGQQRLAALARSELFSNAAAVRRTRHVASVAVTQMLDPGVHRNATQRSRVPDLATPTLRLVTRTRALGRGMLIARIQADTFRAHKISGVERHLNVRVLGG